MSEPKIRHGKISDYRPAEVNPNAGTVRGVPAIVDSLQHNGAGRSILVDRDGEAIAGSHTIQAFADAGMTDVIEIETDGTQLVVVKRTDLDLTTDAKARALQISDNRTTILGYQQDDELVAGLLAQLAAEDARLVQAAGFDDADVRNLLNSLSPLDDPNAEWVGMPEFEHDDLTAYQSIHVHFKSKEDVEDFAKLVGQSLTDKTRSIWYPKQEIIRYGVASEP